MLYGILAEWVKYLWLSASVSAEYLAVMLPCQLMSEPSRVSGDLGMLMGEMSCVLLSMSNLPMCAARNKLMAK